MKKIPHITIEQAVAIDKQEPDYWYAVVNERIDTANEIALAEQQESEYITAEQARTLFLDGGSVEMLMSGETKWIQCTSTNCWTDDYHGRKIVYRAIKQAPKETVDPNEAYNRPYKTELYCMVALKGEPAKRMLRSEAQELQRQTKDTHDWFTTKFGRVENWDLDFNGQGTYTYAPKALKKILWSDMPVGVMTNKGELRFVNPVNNMACCEKGEKSLNNWVIVEQLTLAPASEQPWIPTIAPHEGLVVEYSKFSECMKITGIAEGYVLGGAV